MAKIRQDQVVNLGPYTGSFTGSFTGLLEGTSSVAVSSSYALSSSYSTQSDSASLAVTASHAEFADTASWSTNSITASIALTASFLSGSIESASYSAFAVSASHALNSDTASFLLGSIESASYSSFAASASYAITASYALNGGGSSIDTASFATTGSNNFTGDQTVSGSIVINGNEIFDGEGDSGLNIRSNQTQREIYIYSYGTDGSGSEAANLYINENTVDIFTSWNGSNQSQWTFSGSAFIIPDGSDILYSGSLTPFTASYSQTTAPISFPREIHVDWISGDDDNGDGSLNYPYKTVTKAFSEVANGYQVVIHPGTYLESPTITTPNVTITSVNSNDGGIVDISGTLTANITGTSVRILGISIDNLIHLGSSSLYLDKCIILNSFIKNSSGYTEINDTDLEEATTIQFNAGTSVILGEGQNQIVCSGSNTTVFIKNALQTVSPIVIGGTMVINDSIVYPLASGSAAITSDSGSTVSIQNSQIVASPEGAPERVDIDGWFAYDDIQFNKSLSNLGTSLNTQAYFQKIDVDSLIATGSLLGTASYATQAISASYALTASYSINTQYGTSGSNVDTLGGTSIRTLYTRNDSVTYTPGTDTDLMSGSSSDIWGSRNIPQEFLQNTNFQAKILHFRTFGVFGDEGGTDTFSCYLQIGDDKLNSSDIGDITLSQPNLHPFEILGELIFTNGQCTVCYSLGHCANQGDYTRYPLGNAAAPDTVTGFAGGDFKLIISGSSVNSMTSYASYLQVFN